MNILGPVHLLERLERIQITQKKNRDRPIVVFSRQFVSKRPLQMVIMNLSSLYVFNHNHMDGALEKSVIIVMYIHM